MRKIDALLAEYDESHQNATNKTIHWICVPLIFFSVVALIASIPAGVLESMAGQKDAFVTAIYQGKRVYLKDLEKLGLIAPHM